MKKCVLCLALLWALAPAAEADTIALWNFNDAVASSTGGALEFLVDRGAGVMFSSFPAASVGNIGGTLVNSQEGDPAGQALRLTGNGNNGLDLVWQAGTAGYESIVVSFASQRSGTGFSRNQFYYSADSGGTWTSFGDVFDPPSAYGLLSFNLSAVALLNDNPDAAFRIVFDGASSASGNNRLDNLLVSGSLIPEPPLPPQAVPEPSTMILMAAGLAFAGAARLFRRPPK